MFLCSVFVIRIHNLSRFCFRSSGEAQPDQLRLLSMDQLISGLQPLALWMANSIELLHFIQHEVPQLLPWRQEEEEEGGRRDSGGAPSDASGRFTLTSAGASVCVS